MTMDEKMKVEVKVGTLAMIKPSSPTPHHKRFVQLSLLDQLKSPVHIKIVVFYPPPPPAVAAAETNPRLLLTTSLSQVLTQFYPYAGKFKDNSRIECTDDGVVYTEAELDGCTIEDAISLSKGGHPTGIWDHLLPGGGSIDHLDDGGVRLEAIPLLIQANFFKCGGLALGLAASHRIMDASALSSFICSWASVASSRSGTSNTGTAAVDFTISSSLYPPNDLLNDMPPPPPPQLPTAENICVTKRYVFDGTSINALKMKLGATPPPTRVEAVSALIWKSVITMKTSSGDACSNNNDHLCRQMVNTRRRWQPPLPDNTPGNHISHFNARKRIDCTKVESKQELLRDLVYRLKDGLREFCDNAMKKLQDSVPTVRSVNIFEDRMAKMTNRDHESSSAPFAIMISSWCGFRLYDNADFGWGKPEWIGLRPSSTNLIQLMDTKEGNGIEAWVTLGEPHMAAFEQDQDLQLFAS